MVSGRTIVNAIVGAVVGVVLSFIPFSTIIGGAVAGFLEGPNGRDGAIVGALAGVITFVPIAGIAVLVLGLLGFGLGVATAPVEGFVVAVFLIVAVTTAVFVYTVGLSLLGGYLGAYLAREYPDRHARTREAVGFSDRNESRRRAPDARRRNHERGRDRRETDRSGRRSRGTDRAPSGDGRADAARDDPDRNERWTDPDGEGSRTDRERNDRRGDPDRDPPNDRRDE